MESRAGTYVPLACPAAATSIFITDQLEEFIEGRWGSVPLDIEVSVRKIQRYSLGDNRDQAIETTLERRTRPGHRGIRRYVGGNSRDRRGHDSFNWLKRQ